MSNIEFNSETPIAPAFESLMASGVAAHAAGNHQEALDFRTAAFWASGNVVESARALRDGAASHGYLDQFDKAKEGAGASVQLLRDAYTAEPENTPIRELGASRDRYARVLSAIAIKNELAGGNTLTRYDASHKFSQAWGDFRQAEKRISHEPYAAHRWPFSIDQYRINMASRHAVNEALFAHKRYDAFLIAFRGLGISVLSQNPLLPHSDQEKIGFRKRFKIAVKDVVAAGVGVAITTLANVSRKPSRRRTKTLEIANWFMR